MSINLNNGIVETLVANGVTAVNGQIYIGNTDTDASKEENYLPSKVEYENGETEEVTSYPLKADAEGYLIYNFQRVKLYIPNKAAVLILNAADFKVYDNKKVATSESEPPFDENGEPIPEFDNSETVLESDTYQGAIEELSAISEMSSGGPEPLFGDIVAIWDGGTFQDNSSAKLDIESKGFIFDTTDGIDELITFDVGPQENTYYFSTDFLISIDTDVDVGIGQNDDALRFTMPVDDTCDNTLFIRVGPSAIESYVIYACDPVTHEPQQLMSINTQGGSTSGVSFFRGPRDETSYIGTYTQWVDLAIPKEFIDQYAVNGQLKVAMCRSQGTLTQANQWDVSGLAVVKNPNAAQQLGIFLLSSALNGGTEWDRTSLSLAQAMGISPDAGVTFSGIRLPVVDQSRDAIFTIFYYDQGNSTTRRAQPFLIKIGTDEFIATVTPSSKAFSGKLNTYTIRASTFKVPASVLQENLQTSNAGYKYVDTEITNTGTLQNLVHGMSIEAS